MILEHTTHAGYIRQDDVYTDENGVNYTVCQDTDAGDPRSWKEMTSMIQATSPPNGGTTGRRVLPSAISRMTLT